MKNRWFEEIFLPSLLERSHNHEVRLTGKQVVVCAKYMEPHCGSSFDDIGRHREWKFWTYEWKSVGRFITVRPPFPNGCSTMEFGLSDEEKAEAERIGLAKKEEQRQRMISFLKEHPERMERHMAAIRKMETELAQFRADLAVEEDDDEIEYLTACVRDTEERILRKKHEIGIA